MNNTAQNILKNVMDEDYPAAKHYAKMTGWDIRDTVWFENEQMPLGNALQLFFYDNKPKHSHIENFEDLF